MSQQISGKTISNKPCRLYAKLGTMKRFKPVDPDLNFVTNLIYASTWFDGIDEKSLATLQKIVNYPQNENLVFEVRSCNTDKVLHHIEKKED